MKKKLHRRKSTVAGRLFLREIFFNELILNPPAPPAGRFITSAARDEKFAETQI
jgi:hypothetical protein